MTVQNAGLNGVLKELTAKKAQKLASDMGDKDTTHPTASAPNSTQDASTGARASESSSDVKDQQSLSVESTGTPEDRQNPSGSQGVDDKKSDEGAEMDKGDTSGTSDMANKDTTHPSASKSANEQLVEKAAAALDLLTEAINKADEAEKADEGEGKVATAEELEKYASELEAEEGAIVAEGEKFAEEVLGVMANLATEAPAEKTAEHVEKVAQLKYVLKKAMGPEAEPAAIDASAEELAGAGVAPEELEAELGGGEGEADEIEAVLQQLIESGVSPEELEALAAQEQLGEDEQMGALDAAMGESGVTADDITAAGGTVPEEAVGKAASVKVAADKTAAFTTFKNHLVKQLTALKENNK